MRFPVMVWGTGRLGRHLPPQVKQGKSRRLPEAKSVPVGRRLTSGNPLATEGLIGS